MICMPVCVAHVACAHGRQAGRTKEATKIKEKKSKNSLKVWREASTGEEAHLNHKSGSEGSVDLAGHPLWEPGAAGTGAGQNVTPARVPLCHEICTRIIHASARCHGPDR
ncbi:unnamed protein product, partial [Iphiclides podalirius]